MSNCNLFQLPIQQEIIDTWTPLRTCTSHDCGPTALVVTGIKSKESMKQYVGEHIYIKKSGIQPYELVHLIQSSKKELRIEYNEIKHDITNLANFLRENLFPGNITVLALTRNLIMGHIVTIGRINNDFVLYEGQSGIKYTGDLLDNFLLHHKFTSFHFLCSKPNIETEPMDIDMGNKRLRSSNGVQIRKIKEEDPPQKKIRSNIDMEPMGANKDRKKRRTSNKKDQKKRRTFKKK